MSVEHERSIVNSALWSAAGDAIGWITELGDTGAVRARTGADYVSAPVSWKRRIGGRGGVQVVLPAGTYSDDTQLRLAVCRSIRGDSTFDPETFARIELTSWQSYALGAGRGTKAAAANLAKRGVNWFSNFFETKGQNYLNAGGNGAAMRIQPHVWARRGSNLSFVLPVLRDSLITHGHPHGFCGAVFHALAVADAVDERQVTDWGAWRRYVSYLAQIPSVISEDRHLQDFWLPSWEKSSGETLDAAIDRFISEAKRDLDLVRPLISKGPTSYSTVLHELGCFQAEYRGSGWKTALAASVLAWLCRDRPTEEALMYAANALDSDTDTIATMAGAILGAISRQDPPWSIQDRDYIELEARRLASIARGDVRDSFSYPDPGKWQPASSQSDAILLFDDRYAIAGLGAATPTGEEQAAGAFVWQWMKLDFGQTILGKRKKDLKKRIQSSQLPGERRQASAMEPILRSNAMRLPLDEPKSRAAGRAVEARRSPPASPPPPPRHLDSTRVGAGSAAPSPALSKIDRWTDAVIQSDFDNRVLGQMFNRCIDDSGSIEGAAAFAGIIAKAKLSRRRRQG